MPSNPGIPNPPADHRLVAGPLYDSYEDLAEDLSAFGAQHGFHFSVRRRRKPRNGKPTRVDLYCDRGRPRPSRGTIRSTGTMKTECTWKAYAAAKAETAWKWTIRFEGKHCDHSASEQPTEHVGLRGFNDEQKAHIYSLFDLPYMPNRAIATTLQQRWPDLVFIVDDIRNLRQHWGRQKRSGYTPTQAVLRQFDDEGIKHTVRFSDTDPNQVRGLLWTYPWCEKMWKRFHWVLQLDNTYKTNRFKMALCQVVVVTHLGTVTPVCWALLDNERQDGFHWLCTELDRVRLQCGIPAPEVVITDAEAALKTALAEVFPHARQQLCIFHISQNVVLHIKRKWQGPEQPARPEDESHRLYRYDEGGNRIAIQATAAEDPLAPADDDQADTEDINYPIRTGRDWVASGQLPHTVEHSRAGAYLLWQHILYAEAEVDFDCAWQRMEALFADQGALLSYLQGLLPTKEQWAQCYIAKNRNFGLRVSSPAEATHRHLKSYLVHGNSTILRLDAAIRQMLNDIEVRFNTLTGRNRNHRLFQHLGQQWLGDAPRQVSGKALNLLHKQYLKA